MFGTPCEHNGRSLPTYSGVMMRYNFVRKNLKLYNNNKEHSFKDISNQVINYLEVFWKTVSIPSVTNKRVKDLLRSYHMKYVKIVKLVKTRNSDSTLEKLKFFRDDGKNKLLDISLCKCK